MDYLHKLGAAAALGLACFVAQAQTSQAPAKLSNAEALSAEAFFKPAQMADVDISPSGRFMSIREVNPEGRVQLKVIDLEGKEPPVVVAKFSKLDVSWADWIDDNWLVFMTYEEARKGSRPDGPGLAAVSRDGKRLRELVAKRWSSEFQYTGNQALEPDHSLLGYGLPGSNEVVLEQLHYETTGWNFSHSTLRIQNVSTGGVRSMFKDRPAPPGKIKGWTLDAMGAPRVAYAYEKDQMIVYWADPVTKEWKTIAQFNQLEPEFFPAYVDEKDNLFVSVNNPQTHLAEIRKFNFATGKPEKEALLSLPGFDAYATPIVDAGSNRVFGLRTATDATSVAWFSPLMAKIQQKADALLPGRVNYLKCRPCSSPKVVLISSWSDTEPGDYLIYRVAEDKFERVGAERPQHRGDLMANLELYRTKTRDGADLPVWITQLSGKAQPRPAVVLVHGGPWERGGAWRWDPEAQFLATRGYVVIEPEFRGSTGFGNKHYRDGWKQWGQRMQDDVTDALKFAVDKGWVDPNKVCIAGASYGGYSTLIGLAKDPGLYKCGVAWVAVSDPPMMYTVHWSDVSDRSKLFSMPEMIGDLEKDAAMLKANSPLALASKIKAPVLLAYGAKDWRVPIVHGEKMRAALTEAGNPPEWVVYDDEGHGWKRTPNQIDFWRRVERFLGQHLK